MNDVTNMPDLVIQKLGDGLKSRLYEDAGLHGRPIDEHVRVLLAAALDLELSPTQAESEQAFAVEHFDAAYFEADGGVEHIEMVAGENTNQDAPQRGITRVEHRDITARFRPAASGWRRGGLRRFHPCEIADISLRGARIRSCRQLREGEVITLDLRHRDGDTGAIEARIVRVTVLGDTRYEYGVRFLETMPKNLHAAICRKVIDQRFAR